jgi:putative ABC transport system permease protein
MYKHYLKQMFQLFKENKLISCISILGTALSICMIMVIVILYQMNTENIAPETNRDRMLYINDLTVVTDKFSGTNGMSRYLMLEGFYTLQLPERVAAIGGGLRECFMSVPGIKEEMKGELLLTDASFWQMFDFTFVAGSAYTEEEFESAVKYVVIDEAYARTLYGSAAMAVGKRIDLDYEEYTVKGVVKSVNPFFKSTYANVWVPYTVDPNLARSKTTNFGGYTGGLSCYILAASSSDIPAIRLEVQGVLDRFNANNKKFKLMLDEPPLNHFDQTFRSDQINPTALRLRYILIITLLLLVPAINLTGLTFSHMQKRQSEMGVRRAFGATQLQLLKQVLMENVIYSLLGGVVGLLLAYASLWLFDEILLQTTSQGETMLSLDMLHPLVFVYTFLFCLLFNCLSAGIPALRVSRVNIVSSINN